jgi:hypothetical protein
MHCFHFSVLPALGLTFPCTLDALFSLFSDWNEMASPPCQDELYHMHWFSPCLAEKFQQLSTNIPCPTTVLDRFLFPRYTRLVCVTTSASFIMYCHMFCWVIQFWKLLICDVRYLHDFPYHNWDVCYIGEFQLSVKYESFRILRKRSHDTLEQNWWLWNSSLVQYSFMLGLWLWPIWTVRNACWFFMLIYWNLEV